jgi:dihydroflavonol-4-reductase
MIAVTGANGLLGKFIIKRLNEEKLDVIAISRTPTPPIDQFSSHTISYRSADITDPVAIEEVLKDATCVIHAAAFVSLNPRASQKMFDTNVNGTKNIVDACLRLQIPKLIHISSVAAIGKPRGVKEITEANNWIPGKFNTIYAESKHLAEIEVYRGAEEGLSVSIINPSVILAPGDWNRSSAKLFKFVWDEKPFYTEGQFNFVDVRDLVDLIFCLYQNNISGEKYIASAGSATFLEFFQKVATRFNKRPPSFNIPAAAIGFLGALDSLKSRLTGTDPLIDRKALRTNRESFIYSNQKAVQTLKKQFRSLEETLDWCCREYVRHYTINK